jgi:error-prone DNA polymerase
MEKNGVAPEVIVKIIQSISSFALYGFPESHAISFAILAYGSAYLKVHRAAEFYASLLNNQPMGFYAPADDREGCAPAWASGCGRSAWRNREWRCTVESDESVRLGFCVVNGLRQELAEELVRQRKGEGNFARWRISSVVLP